MADGELLALTGSLVFMKTLKIQLRSVAIYRNKLTTLLVFEQCHWQEMDNWRNLFIHFVTYEGKCHRGGKRTWPDRDSNPGSLAYRASSLPMSYRAIDRLHFPPA